LLRRLEQNHDGFRTENGRQKALKIYQAGAYLGWSIHHPPNLAASDGEFGGTKLKKARAEDCAGFFSSKLQTSV
jgi:hypothetical protein